MGNNSIDTTRLRRALAAAAALLAIVTATVVAAKCSSPSQVVTAPAQGPSPQEASAPVNAAAVAQARLDEWAGQRVAVAGVEWLDADAAAVTAALPGGEHVAITVVRTPAGWQAPWPPAAVAAAPVVPVEAYADIPPAAAGDVRWQTAVGFLGAWLAGDDPWRWTHAGFRPDPPAVAYPEWSIAGAGQPLAVPGAPIAVLPVDVDAAAAGGAQRRYRFWVAVRADADGQIGVTALAHRPPPPALGEE
ncbi:hypothetical protein [Candidatus Poriferisocius sp.]|uniref:hypothetical protein n=1 Tax=Candidatus Poriferisocius sp. TaxID=3101276 RepID=UPI003B52FA4C